MKVKDQTQYSKKIDAMREGGKILAAILREVSDSVQPGITTLQLDNQAMKLFEKYKMKPAFLGYQGFPKCLCTSLNEEVVHGIPGERVLQDGDILSIDIGGFYNGYCSDMAITLPVGTIDDQTHDLLDAGSKTLSHAVDVLHPGMKLRDLSSEIQDVIFKRGYDVVRKYVGHAIGKKMHEDPQIPNFVNAMYPPESILLNPGLVIAIEPMLTVGTADVETLKDGWTVVTRDRKLSCHFEHSVAILEDRVEILTLE